MVSKINGNIESTGPIGPSNKAGKQSGASEAAKAGGLAPIENSSVSQSEEAALLKVPPKDDAKVAALREKISDGSYQVNSYDIADKMIDDVRRTSR